MARVAGLFDARAALVSRVLPKLGMRERNVIGILRVSADRAARIDWVRRAPMRPRLRRSLDAARETPLHADNRAVSGKVEAARRVAQVSAGSQALVDFGATPAPSLSRTMMGDRFAARTAAPMVAPSSIGQPFDTSYAQVGASSMAGTATHGRARGRWIGDGLTLSGAPLRKAAWSPARQRWATSMPAGAATAGRRVPDASRWYRSSDASGLAPTAAMRTPAQTRFNAPLGVWRGSSGGQGALSAWIAPGGMSGTGVTGFAPSFSASGPDYAPSFGTSMPMTGAPGFAPDAQGTASIGGVQDDRRHHSGHGVNLTGEIIIDGRQLGMVIAREQTRQASLPATRGSAIEVGAMPLYLNNSGSF